MKKTAWLLIVFSGFFVSLLPISPIYLTTAIAGIFLFLNIFRSKIFYFNRTMLLALMFIVYLVFFQTIGSDLKNNSFFNVVFSLLYFTLTFMAIYNVSSNKITSISKSFIRVSILLLLVEAGWRLTHPFSPQGYIASGDTNFYQYKYSSIMYQDSNYVGIFIISLFFFCIYLKRYELMKLNTEMLILSVLCLLTFSRASIASLVLFLFLFGIKSFWKKVYLAVIPLAIGVKVYMDFVTSDVSFLSRLQIIDITWYHLQTTSLYNVLFGVGFGNSVDYLGIGAHNIIVTYLVESGLIGFGMLVILWVYILRKTNYHVGIVMLPFLFNGMSLAGHAIPYLYCIFAIVYALEKKRTPTVAKNEPVKKNKIILRTNALQ